MRSVMILVIGVIGVLTCNAAIAQKYAIDCTCQVRFDSSVEGTVTVTSLGFGKKLPMATADASASAIYILLFRGIAGSPYETPMINDVSKAGNSVIQTLFAGGYTSFITEDDMLGSQKMTRKVDGVKGYSGSYRITINCDALRRFLEQNHVVRKFGI